MEVAMIKEFASKKNTYIDNVLPKFEEIYKDIHTDAQLSTDEEPTFKIAADYLIKYQYLVTTNVGSTGVVGVMKKHPVVMLRVDIDALPVTAPVINPTLKTGLHAIMTAAARWFN